ncbi:hypothetical protein FBR02_05040 [Anaerolineae bacterium CFX9]|nr:hypothetical protein [Anaerolineae bacterium CFX9]
MSRLRLLFLVCLALLAVACAPARSASQQPIPTLMSLPSRYPLESAERIAREFLQNWDDGNYEWMYDLITYASQETTPRDNFINLYADARQTMGLTDLLVEPTGIYRQQDEIAILTYNVTFQTTMGAFGDDARTLQMVVDERVQDWRVAWTPADLFPELSRGGRLQLQRSAPNRANIYDRDGDVLADQNGRVVSVNVVRQSAANYPDCLNTLSAALSQPVSDIQTRWEARPASELVEIGTIEAQAYVETHLALEQFCGATFNARPARRYPDGTVMPHIVGYVGFPDEAEIEGLRSAGFGADSIIGRSGVERTWDATLRGTPSTRLVIVNPSGVVLRELASSPAVPGQSLWLTIDSDFQRAVQQIVADAFTQAKDGWGAVSPGASVVVMDVNTGAILAMVSYPTFDNNVFTAFPPMGRADALLQIQEYARDPRNPEVNRPTQGIYTLGSVMKTISAAAAADSGVYALDQRYMCTGIWNRDITRYDWNSGHGMLTLAGSLTQSCNPYYYEVGYNLYMADPDLLPDYAERLGFGVPTGLLDLPELPGFIPTPQWFRASFGYEMPFSEEVNMAIGQGYVQVTPLQVARWFGAIANGGTLYRPYLVQQSGLIGDEITPAYQPLATETGLRPEVIDTIQSGLCAVTTASFGTAEFVFRNSPLQSIGVCGKTGTAQTGPTGTLPHAWFAAYAPRVNPEIAVAVMVETAGEGSAVAAPIARQVMEAYYGMLP